MDTFYIFDEYGDFQFTTTDEDFQKKGLDNEPHRCYNKCNKREG